jgi:hypothetical protein
MNKTQKEIDKELRKEKLFTCLLIFFSIVVLVLVIKIIIIFLVDNGVLSFGTYFKTLEITYILCVVGFVGGKLSLILALIGWYGYTEKEREIKEEGEK